MVFASIAACLRTLLQCLERFAAFTMSQVFGLGVGIISLLVLKPKYGIHAAAMAITLSYLAEILFMLPFLVKEDAFKAFHVGSSSRAIEATKLFMTYLISSAVMQVNTTIDRWLASSLPESSISYISHSSNAEMMARVLLGGGFCMALIPLMARQASAKDSSRFDQSLALNIRFMVLVFFPYVFAVLLIGPEMISVLFERGMFNQQSVQGVSKAWYFYALGAFAYSVGRPIQNALYIHKKAVLQLQLTLGCLVLNVMLNLLLMRLMGYLGLPLATTLAMSAFYFAVAFAFHKTKSGVVPWKGSIFPTIGVAAIAGILSGGVCWGALQFVSEINTFLEKIALLAWLGALGGGVYITVLLALKEQTCCSLVLAMKKRFYFKGDGNDTPSESAEE